MNVIKFKSSFSIGDVHFFKEYQRVLTPVRQASDIIQGEENAYMGILLPTLAMALKQLQALMDSGGISVCHPLLRAMIEGIEARFSAQFEDLDCIVAFAFHPHFKLVWVECLDDLKYDTREITRKARSAIASVLEDQNANLDNISGSSDGDDSAADDFFSSLYRKSEKEKNSTSKLVQDFLDENPKRKFAICKESFPTIQFQQLFIKFNTPLPSSAAVERLFSLGKDVLKPKRTGLRYEHFELLVFLKGNTVHLH